MQNLLLQPLEVEYLEQDNGKGIWRRFMFPDGRMFAEFKTHQTLFGVPLLHITWGRNPETMRYVTAKGIIAIGRFAYGGLAIGQVSGGIIAIGQLGIGCLFGLGQATTGVFALGQLAIGGLIGIGQLTCGHMAIGQLAAGTYVLAQFGVGDHVWDTFQGDPLAVQFFRQLLFK
jgi:hypothetical protein